MPTATPSSPWRPARSIPRSILSSSLAIGTVESGYDPQATSRSDARGLYQIWPSTGRMLLRGLGWSYDESALYDPEKNTQAAALYLDILFSTYSDPQLVLAEYNGGPLNAGYFRAGVGALAAETRNYVPRVLQLHARLKDDFDKGMACRPKPCIGTASVRARRWRARPRPAPSGAKSSGAPKSRYPSVLISVIAVRSPTMLAADVADVTVGEEERDRRAVRLAEAAHEGLELALALELLLDRAAGCVLHDDDLPDLAAAPSPPGGSPGS